MYTLRPGANISSFHYIDVIMSTMASQITSLTVVYSIVYSKKTSKLRVTGLCARNSLGPVNSPHKGPVMRKMFLFDDIILCRQHFQRHCLEWKLLNFKLLYFIEICSSGFNWRYVSNGSDSGLAQNRRDAIIRCNYAYMHRPASMS